MRERILALILTLSALIFFAGTVIASIGAATSDENLRGIGLLVMVGIFFLGFLGFMFAVDAGVKEFEEYDTGWC